MRQFLICLFLLLSTGHLNAQSLAPAKTETASKQQAAPLEGQPRIDSILKELPRQKEDINKVKLLNDLSYDYFSIDPDEGIKCGLLGLELAKKLNWNSGIADANNCLGNDYRCKSDYPKALECYFKALSVNEELGNKKGIVAATNNIGLVYEKQSDFPKALEYFFKALTLFEAMGDRTYVAKITNNIGIVYYDQKDYPKALEYSSKALKMAEELGNKDAIAAATGNIGSVYDEQKDYPKALEYFNRALKIYEELGDKSGMAYSTASVGGEYRNQKNYIMAVEYYQRALKLSEELGDKFGIALALGYTGSMFVAIVRDTVGKGNKAVAFAELPESKYQHTSSIPRGRAALLAGAIDHLQRSLTICREINALDVMQEVYDFLSQAYKLKEDYKLAMVYGDSSRVIKDSVFSQENKNQITRLENKRREFADSLKAADAKIVADVKAAHRRNYELIGVGMLALAVGFIFVQKKNYKLLDIEKKRSDSLLLNILPEEVAVQLKDTGKATAKQFDNVTVLFTDFVNFTEASGRMKPEALIDELHVCFMAFDEITAKYNIEKIKTIGDAYLAVCGLPSPDPKHAENIIRAAMEINAFIQDRVAKLGDRTFQIRIGVHTGDVVAGIVGVRKFAYDVWGDTVNTAARMEQNSTPGRINISETTYNLVKDKFDCEYRGEIAAKGKGAMKMYFVA